jgi:hypothetical protein
MADEEEPSIEEILASIRNVLWEKEVEKSASRSCLRDYAKEAEGEIFDLTPEMLVPNDQLPYEYAEWTFDDVATRLLNKCGRLFAREDHPQKGDDLRVSVKEDG